jgi:hypothetical protein
MSEKPEALRLATQLEKYWGAESGHDRERQAAAELRRLHTLCGEWEKKAATWLASPQAAQRLDGYRELAQRLNAAEAVNQDLLAVLQDVMDSPRLTEVVDWWVRARAAIAKAEAA